MIDEGRAVARTVRSLVRAPAFSLGVALTLALGIGATAAALSVARGVLLRALPHRNGDRLVYVRQSAEGAGVDNMLFSVPEISDYRAGTPSFASVAEFSSMRFSALDLDRPRQVHAGVVTGNYFDVMGLGTILGRGFGADDDGEAADPVAVLTPSFWRTVFGGDPSVVGTTFRLDGRVVTIVGVAEPHPPYPERTDLYVNMVASPHHMGAAMNHDRTHRMTEMFARLAPGATLDAARSEIEVVAGRMRAEHREAYDDGYAYDVHLTTLQSQLAHRARTVVMILGATAFLVLLVSLANVANLTLARAVRLEDELSVRLALGATRGAARRRLLRENALLAGAGALLGLALAILSTPVLSAYVGRFSVRAGEIRMDGWVVLSALALSAATALALTWLTRLPDATSEVNLRANHGVGLVRQGRSGVSRGSRRVQSAMVTAQVAVSLMLVFGAALLAKTLRNLQDVDTGMEVEDVLAMDLPVVENGRSFPEILQDHLAMVDEVRAIPGVEAAALTNVVPLRTGSTLIPWTFDFSLEGRSRLPGEAPYRADFRTVMPDYFATLGVPIVEGRGIEDSDDVDASKVVVVNEAFVRRFLGGRPALGTRVAWSGDVLKFIGVSDDWRTIVGVSADMHEHGVDVEPVPTVFNPHRQDPFGRAMLVRASGDASLIGQTVAKAIRGVEPDQPIENVASLAQVRRDTLGNARLNSELVTLLAFLSLLIAAVGIFAALAFSVSQRSREMGIRMAVGADRGRVIRTVVAEGMTLVAVGLGVGVGGALIAARLLRSVLFGIAPTDAPMLAGSAAGLAFVTLAATLLPALRAARVDPARVLTRS